MNFKIAFLSLVVLPTNLLCQKKAIFKDLTFDLVIASIGKGGIGSTASKSPEVNSLATLVKNYWAIDFLETNIYYKHIGILVSPQYTQFSPDERKIRNAASNLANNGFFSIPDANFEQNIVPISSDYIFFSLRMGIFGNFEIKRLQFMPYISIDPFKDKNYLKVTGDLETQTGKYSREYDLTEKKNMAIQGGLDCRWNINNGFSTGVRLGFKAMTYKGIYSVSDYNPEPTIVTEDDYHRIYRAWFFQIQAVFRFDN